MSEYPTANVHRFHERVAVSLPIGPTQYLTPCEARALARALRACATDVDRVKFVASEFPSASIQVKDPDKLRINKD